jgi:hypothetical protein
MRVTARKREGKPIAWRMLASSFRPEQVVLRKLTTEEGTAAARELAENYSGKFPAASKDSH